MYGGKRHADHADHARFGYPFFGGLDQQLLQRGQQMPGWCRETPEITLVAVQKPFGSVLLGRFVQTRPFMRPT